MGTRNIEVVCGKSVKKIPDNIRLTGVLLADTRQQYKLGEGRILHLRQPITGVVEVHYEKTTQRVSVDVASYWPLTPTEPIRRA